MVHWRQKREKIPRWLGMAPECDSHIRWPRTVETGLCLFVHCKSFAEAEQVQRRQNKCRGGHCWTMHDAMHITKGRRPAAERDPNNIWTWKGPLETAYNNRLPHGGHSFVGSRLRHHQKTGQLSQLRSNASTPPNRGSCCRRELPPQNRIFCATASESELFRVKIAWQNI